MRKCHCQSTASSTSFKSSAVAFPFIKVRHFLYPSFVCKYQPHQICRYQKDTTNPITEITATTMPEFTLPLRPASTKRWLVRKDTKTDLRAAAAAAAEAGSDGTTHTLKHTRSLSQLADAETHSASPLEPITSHSQLGPRSMDRITKPALKRKPTRANLRAIPEDMPPKSDQDQDVKAEEAAREDGIAFVENHMKDKTSMREMLSSMRSTKLITRQSMPLLGKLTEEPTTEETLEKLAPTELSINKYLVLSSRSYEGVGMSTGESVTILANGLSTLAAFSAELQVEHSNLTQSVLLRSRQPRQWLFRSRPEMEVEGASTSLAREYSRMCNAQDAEHVYAEFLGFLTRRGESEVTRVIKVAKERLANVKGMSKGRAEYTTESLKHGSRQVHVPDAVNVFGDVVIFF